MILPDKNITLRYSILGTAAIVLAELNVPHTVSSFWEKVRDLKGVNTFEKFVLALDFLYSVGLINIEESLLRRFSND